MLSSENSGGELCLGSHGECFSRRGLFHAVGRTMPKTSEFSADSLLRKIVISRFFGRFLHSHPCGCSWCLGGFLCVLRVFAVRFLVPAFGALGLHHLSSILYLRSSAFLRRAGLRPNSCVGSPREPLAFRRLSCSSNFCFWNF